MNRALCDKRRERPIYAEKMLLTDKITETLRSLAVGERRCIVIDSLSRLQDVHSNIAMRLNYEKLCAWRLAKYLSVGRYLEFEDIILQQRILLDIEE